MATAFSFRPSEIMGLTTDLAQWNLDEACLVYGRQIENAYNKNEDPFSTLGNGSQAKYRSANQFVTRKVKIKNGVW